MRSYYVYSDPLKHREPVFVRSGFYIWAALFPLLWSLYHRMWSVSLLLIILMLMSSNSMTLLQVVLAIFFGLFGAEVREKYLASIGYQFHSLILAHDDLEAQIKYYNQHNIKI